MTLNELNQGEKAIISKVKGRGAFRKRIMEMGFVQGKEVLVVRKAPLKDPVEYRVMDYDVSLRNSEAEMIEIVTEIKKPISNFVCSNCIKVENDCILKNQPIGNEINIVLVGNPNSGKTTLFNHITGLRERVGNYSGVTIDAKEAKIRINGYIINIIDLPGTYSIAAYTPEEIFVRKYITEKSPDVVVNIVDASNIERNLYLTTQLIDMDVRVVVALNMFDELEAKGDILNYTELGKLIGCPIVPTIASKGKGITELLTKVIQVFEDKEESVRHIHINYGETIERSIKNIQSLIKIPDNFSLTDKVSSRFIAIKLLEDDREADKLIKACNNYAEIAASVEREKERINKFFTEPAETIITDARYGFIAGALKETIEKGPAENRKTNEMIDAIFTHKVFGFPIFLLIMGMMFYLTFFLGSFPVAWIEHGVEALSSFLSNHLSDSVFKDLLIDGLVSGMGGVIVFLPNILLLFFFISLMEDTGYMARTVFIMDKLMHKIGLHGKSFIPLLMGFGCNVPAIMATRTLESKNDRLHTMLINPFMSCSARLPIYVLFISAFFPKNQGMVLFLIYFTGIIIAILVSLVLKRFIFNKNEIPFVMELPPYRIPTMRSTLAHMWDRGLQYLKKIGGVILLASLIIWGLGYFPKQTAYEHQQNQKKEQIINKLNEELLALQPYDSLKKTELKEIANNQIRQIEKETKAYNQENSYIGKIGKFIEPVVKPLGFDWRLGISILAGIPAKEIVVGTMSVLLYADEHDETSIISKVKEFKTKDSNTNKEKPLITPLIALSFMLFVLLYSPCIGTIIAIAKESGSWTWGLSAALYTTIIAWIVSFVVFQLGTIFGF